MGQQTPITEASEAIQQPTLAYQSVLHWAATTPNAPAIGDTNRTLDYAELAQAVEQLAQPLRKLGVGAGDRVMIIAENNVAAVVALFASQILGAWPAVANARLPEAELAELRALIDPRIVLFAVDDSEACAEQAARDNAQMLDGLLAGPVALSAVNHNARIEPEPSAAEERVGLVIFTSGTTGRPKAVMHGHRGLLILGETLRQSRKVTAADSYNGVAPLAHIMGIANLMSVLSAGASLRLMPRLELNQMAKAIAQGEISHLSFVPTVYARLLNHIEQQGIDVSGHQLRYISCGGAPLDQTLQQRVQSLFGMPLVNGYGMTECAPGTRTPAEHYSEAGCIGFPEQGVQVRIVSVEGDDLPVGAIGEIWLHSPAAMLGYYQNPSETAKAIRDGSWIATGDLGQWLEDGSVLVVGRQKEMIIRSGFNVYPPEVEAALNSLAPVAACAVVGRTLADGDEQIIAFVELRPGHSIDAEQINAALHQRIAAYKCPNRIVFLPQLPQGSSGKIWKAQLSKMAHSLSDADLSAELPRTPQYTDAPQWLLDAVSVPSQSHFITSDGIKLHYRSWNAHETDKPALLLAHGYRANSHWWDFIAPFLRDRYRVYALDFSGMGLSGPRAEYTAQAFSNDLVGILEHAIGPAIVVGHSYGGLRTLRVCADRPDLIKHAIILDSRVRFLDEDIASSMPLPPPSAGRARFYPQYDTIRQRYRVIPAQPLPMQATFEHAAFHSIQHTDKGWSWTLDPNLPFILIEPDGDALLSSISTPVDYVYGDQSIVVEPWRAKRIAAGLRHCQGAIAIPQSHHHLMLDQPLTLVSVLRTLLIKADGPVK